MTKSVLLVVIRLFAGSQKTDFLFYSFLMTAKLYYSQRFHVLSEVAAQQTGPCSYERSTNLCNTPEAELDANKTDFCCFPASSKGRSHTEAGEERNASVQWCV